MENEETIRLWDLLEPVSEYKDFRLCKVKNLEDYFVEIPYYRDGYGSSYKYVNCKEAEELMKRPRLLIERYSDPRKIGAVPAQEYDSASLKRIKEVSDEAGAAKEAEKNTKSVL